MTASEHLGQQFEQLQLHDVSRTGPLEKHLIEKLGTDTLDPGENPFHHANYSNEVGPHVFRAMSEEHYQKSLRDGFHQSDERGNYIGQGVGTEKEGTVAGRWAYGGYTPLHGPGRIVKIAVHPDDGWKLHPDDEERGYVHTFKPIPTSRFVGVSDPIRRSPQPGWNWKIG